MNREDLGAWIQQRRWYAAKNYPLLNFEILSTTTLTIDTEEIQHVLVATTTEHGRDCYQLLLRSAPREYVEQHVLNESIISSGEISTYEIFGDTGSLLLLQQAFSIEYHFEDIKFHGEVDQAALSTARVITTEQSNSSVVFGDQEIAKFYRRLAPGINPDLEIGLALDSHDCSFVPRISGWVEGPVEGQLSTLAVMHEFYATAVDGFEHALASVRDLIASSEPPAQSGGDFAGEAERLGQAVAGIHRDLEVAFGADTAMSDLFVDEMLVRLERAVAEVPALLPYQHEIARTYERARGKVLPIQRIHGDLHLGQVLRDTSGWKILDFEGEPGASLEQRRAKGPAARDVAGLLRSFDYAARQPLISHPDSERLLRRTSDWAERNRRAFLHGYGTTPDSAIFELDKAVYEAVYEHRFRPDWIGIPLGGIQRLLEER